MDSRSNSASAPVIPQFHPIVLKLDRHNYVFWRAQVLPTIRAHAFDDFISTTAILPSPLLPSQSGAPPRPHPEYSVCIRRDQFLLGWILASISDSMLGHVVRCTSAREAWLTLERLFLSQSKARTMQLRMALQTTKKGAMTIEEYFLKMRSLTDHLSAVGQIVTDEDLQMYILAGFGIDYEALVVNFMQRTDSPSLQEMQLAFQSYELRIAQQLSQFSGVDPSAHAAFYGGARGTFGRGSGSVRGGFAKNHNSKSIVCQLCRKAGHVALKCFRRFDVHFTSNTESASPQGLVADCGSLDDGGEDHMWYMDSGATNHITNELANLSVNADYQGSEAVMVGNGNRPISSVGASSIPVLHEIPILYQFI